MRVHYSYLSYSNCPKATRYSRDAAEAAAYGSMFLGLLSFAAIITFLIVTFSFFGNYDWESFLWSIAFVSGMALLDFYHIVIRENNVSCEVNIILAEERNTGLSAESLKQKRENLRAKSKQDNKEAFAIFFPVFLSALCGSIALIAGIKGVYFLCHKQGGLLLLLGACVTLCVIGLLFWRPSFRSVGQAAPITSNTVQNAITTSVPDNDISFCRKCGAKIPEDSTFCPKCGTKVR